MLIFVTEMRCHHFDDWKTSCPVKVFLKVVALLQVSQVIAPWKEQIHFLLISLPQVLAQACFRCQFSIRWVMVVKVSALQVWRLTLKVRNIKSNVESPTWLICIQLSYFLPTHFLHVSSNESLRIHRLTMNGIVAIKITPVRNGLWHWIGHFYCALYWWAVLFIWVASLLVSLHFQVVLQHIDWSMFRTQ